MTQPDGGASRRDVPTISGLHEFAGRYDAILCDVWGVLIDGKQHFPRAAEALAPVSRGRAGWSCSSPTPRGPSEEVRRQLLGSACREAAYDDLVSAGELTLREIVARKGQACYHLGPPRDNGLFEEAGRRMGARCRRFRPEEADYVVCTGLFDEREEIAATIIDERLAAHEGARSPMLCANPDIVVAHRRTSSSIAPARSPNATPRWAARW